MNNYVELKDRHQKEFNSFPIQFAFSNEQFEEGMAKFGLSPNDTDKVYRFSNTGGFYLRTDAPRLHEMLNRHDKEMQDAIAQDTTGERFIFEMFYYELANHEYIITHDVAYTLDALALEPEDVNKDPRLQHGLYLAKKKYLESFDK